MAHATSGHTQATARAFQALSDDRRLRILSLLEHGERCVCELTEALDVGQSLLSFHLRILREAGLVTDRREGRWVFYSLNPDALVELRGFLTRLSRRSHDRFWEAVRTPNRCR